jgi:voltage-gated potassium channel
MATNAQGKLSVFKPRARRARKKNPLLALIVQFSRSGIALPLALFAAATLVFGTLLWLLEGKNAASSIQRPFDGLWWALVTIATVGYGDSYPLSDAGRAAAMLLMVSGLIITSLVSGTVASLFVERRIREGKGLQDIKIKGHTLLCGWNAHADALLDAIEAEGAIRSLILINSLPAEGFETIKARHPELELRFVRGDHTQEAILRKGSVGQAGNCILVPDSSGDFSEANADERTILAALAIKDMARDLRIRAGILKPESEQHLRRAGVDDIVLHGEFTGYLLSSSSGEGGLPDAARELMSAASPSRLRRAAIPAPLVGKPFSEAAAWFLESKKSILIGVFAKEKPVTLEDILSNDSGAIDAFIKRKFEEAAIDLGEGLGQAGRVRLAPDPNYLISASDLAFVVGGEA